MNIKELIIPGILAAFTVWGINNWLFGPTSTTNSCNQTSTNSFIAPNTMPEKVINPLIKSVNLLDGQLSVQSFTEEIRVPWGTVAIDKRGAILSSIEFNQLGEQQACPIRTIFPKSLGQVDQSALLVAFDETPLDYKLIKNNQTNDFVELVYQTKTKIVDIKKTFIIYKHNYKIDLRLHINPLGQVPLEHVRISFPSPIMSEIIANDVISGVVIDNDQEFKKNVFGKIDMQMGWFTPHIFGSENRYFLHACIADNNQIARAYYKVGDNNELISILELPLIDKPIDTMLSFYFGPKQQESLIAVDARLENSIDFSGFFGSIAKLLLMILKLLEAYLHNFGFAIIVFALFVQLLLLPLTLKSKKALKETEEIQKKMTYLKMKYKNDPDKLNTESAELLRQQGMGSFAGCLLPMLLQTPIFFGLRSILSNSLEFYKAPMLWISDLSASDPYYILPILFVGPMMIQALGQKDSKQATSSILIAIVFGGLTTTLAAGSLLYMAINSLFSMLQTGITNLLSGRKGK